MKLKFWIVHNMKIEENFDRLKFEEPEDIWIGTNILSDHVRSRNVQIPSSCVFKILLSHCMIALLEMPKKVPKKIEFILYDFLIPTINLT